MIARELVDQAKDDLNALGLLVAVVGLGIAVFGPKLLDEGHRERPKGYLAMVLAVIGLALTVSQLVIMGGLVWSALTGHGSFQPWLLLAVVYFVCVIALAVALFWFLGKAIVYTLRAGAD